jgi:pimeloyl-ACP methyl ester carboxylesterase
MTRERRLPVNGIDLVVTDAGDPSAPAVICAHGFPESSYSWRHTLPALADAGFHAIAPDQRGYGASSCPTAVDAYGIEQLAGDLISLLDEAGKEQAVFVGHDWGALIVWDLARLYPERVRAVVGVSVPFIDWPLAPTVLFKAAYPDRFFYILYFQEVGPAETELGRDPRRTMAKILWGASGDAYRDDLDVTFPVDGTGFLDVMPDLPAQLPAWLNDADIDHFAAQFAQSGFFGPVSYYRNLDANWLKVKEFPPSRVAMPSFFIAGDRDVVVARNPAGIEAMKAVLPNLRGVVMIPGVGHWTQQEAPQAFNDALIGFLRTL